MSFLVCRCMSCVILFDLSTRAPASKVESVQLVKLDYVIFFSLDLKLAGGLECGSQRRSLSLTFI